MNPYSMQRYPLRYLGELAIGVLVAALVVRTWLVMGLVVPVTVAGSSMAPTLQGPHRAFHCPDCKADFTIGLDQQPRDLRAACPVCGSGRAIAADEATIGGDRLMIDRAAFVWRSPRRWEVVVFRCPQQADQLCVKRVVGLPGERVSLARGDVLIDGRLVRKSLAEQQALRQLVYRAAGSRELTSLEEAAWKIDLAPIPDAMLTTQVHLAGDGKLRLVIDSKLGRFAMSCDARTGQIRVHRDGWLLAEETLLESHILAHDSHEWTFSLFDRQALVAIDNRIALVAPFEAHEGPESPSFPAQPPRTTTAILGLRGTIHEPTFWRDAYYEYRYGDRPTNASYAATWRLGPDEFFVLGDNAEISDDSRSWSTRPGLDAKLLIGKPLGVR